MPWMQYKQFKYQATNLVKGPKIKKRESMVFGHTPLTPLPP